jgi:hypothetical protein
MLPPKIKARVDVAQTLWNNDAVPAQSTTVSSSAHLSSTNSSGDYRQASDIPYPWQLYRQFHSQAHPPEQAKFTLNIGLFAGNLTERFAE